VAVPRVGQEWSRLTNTSSVAVHVRCDNEHEACPELENHGQSCYVDRELQGLQDGFHDAREQGYLGNRVANSAMNLRKVARQCDAAGTNGYIRRYTYCFSLSIGAAPRQAIVLSFVFLPTRTCIHDLL
jgi:hypothetical protein